MVSELHQNVRESHRWSEMFMNVHGKLCRNFTKTSENHIEYPICFMIFNGFVFRRCQKYSIWFQNNHEIWGLGGTAGFSTTPEAVSVIRTFPSRSRLLAETLGGCSSRSPSPAPGSATCSADWARTLHQTSSSLGFVILSQERFPECLIWFVRNSTTWRNIITDHQGSLNQQSISCVFASASRSYDIFVSQRCKRFSSRSSSVEYRI